jgi:hypothetical protein
MRMQAMSATFLALSAVSNRQFHHSCEMKYSFVVHRPMNYGDLWFYRCY